jgi:hypothetical protein
VGRNDAAIYWETKALNLAKLHLDSMRVKFYQETIEYIHMGKPTWAVSKIKKIDTSKVSGNGNNTVISGVWVIKSRDLISGTLYANAVPITMKLSLKPESLQIEQTSIGEGGTNNNIIYELSLSGTPLPSITKSNRKKVQQLSWIDKKKTMFRINTVLSAPNNDKEVESRNEELLSLSSDGQQLTILKKSKSVKSDSWEIKAVYERQ